MYTHFNARFNSTVSTIHPGEYYATKDDIIIGTVLGSCIAVALFDERNRIGGLNHFMLPGILNPENFYISNSGKYGMYAMELLINELIKLGSRKQDLTAKVFGGGSVLHKSTGFSNRIPENNIEFAFSYLKTEGIPIKSSDVGGVQARKIFYYPRTSKVLLKRIGGKMISVVEKEEFVYFQKVKKDAEKKIKDGPTTLF
jgi:chemotaxis protein CheD